MSTLDVVELHGVSFCYPDGRRALTDVTLNVAAGEKVGLVGPNGAGKSTLLLHLNGILRSQGVVRIAGHEVTRRNLRIVRSMVGLVFQDPNDQLFSPTVRDDVAFGPLHMGLPGAEVLERVEWALEQVNMSEHGDRVPHHLSLGEKKRVAIATVLSMKPPILALDEPSSGLDPGVRRTVLDLLRGLPQTMIIASHDLGFVQELCNRFVVLDKGHIVDNGSPEKLLAWV